MLMLVVLGSILSTGLCMPGGYSTVDKTSPSYSTYTDLLKEQKTTNLLGSLDVSAYTIAKIETQVVAGLNIKYTFNTNGGTCHLVIFDQSWTGTRSVHDNTCAQNGKRQLGGMLAGGYSEQKGQDEIQKYTEMLATLQSSTQLDSTQYTVQKVETQVVSGLNIRYTLLINGATCTVVVWDQPWTNTRQVTENTCKHARRQLLGGYNNVDVNSPQVQQCLSLSVERVNAMSNSMFRMVKVGIVSAQQQVVAGMNYAVTFQMGESTCMKSDYATGKVTSCPLNANSAMSPTTWKAHCFRSLDGTLSFTGVDMVQ